jgi:hypothetical protein
MTMFRSIALFAAFTLAFTMTLAAAPTVSADLAAAQSEAVALRTSADNLMMLARTPMKYSFEAHASELARARSLADKIGVRIRRMNAEQDEATPEQIAQIKAMQAQLLNVVRNTDVGIQAFNHRNGTASLYGKAYQQRVQNLYDGAKMLAKPAASTAIAAD